jgi:drug/metabolite transporter (DMT)-like permease
MEEARQAFGLSSVLPADDARRPARSAARAAALLQAVLVTILWSSSYILIKIGLVELPPLTFAAQRYFLAFVALLALQVLRRQDVLPRNLRPAQWLSLLGLGLLLYTLVPGAMFMSLNMMPVTSVNLVFQAGIPILVALLSGLLLGEPTSPLQWLGVGITVAGVYLFFPGGVQGSQVAGLALASLTAAGVAGSNMLTRSIMRDPRMAAPQVALITMGLGSSLLLVISSIVEQIPLLSLETALILLWLALVNTAFAFTLWNRVLRTLTALEGGVVANAQIIEVAILAWVVLGETMGPQKIVAAAVILAGVTLVQLQRAKHAGKGASPRTEALARGGSLKAATSPRS